MKMKKNVLSFILGAIIFGSISVVSAYTLLASNTGYTPSDETWNVDNVKDALDDIHQTMKGRKIACVALSGNKSTIGSRYGCNLGDGNINYLYILTTNESSVRMIMQENVASGMTWYNAMDYLTTGAGSNLKNQWSNASDVDLPTATDIANAVGRNDWNVLETTKGDDFCFGSIYSSDCIYKGTYFPEARAYNWLYDYTRECSGYGCEHSLSSAYAFGYWTKEEDSQKSNYAWYVDRKGGLTEDYEKSQSTYFGVRLVVTMSSFYLSE